MFSLRTGAQFCLRGPDPNDLSDLRDYLGSLGLKVPNNRMSFVLKLTGVPRSRAERHRGRMLCSRHSCETN